MAYGAILIGCVCIVAIMFNRTPTEIPLPELPESTTVKPQHDPQVRHRFFDQSVQPKIAAAETANREAVARCLKRIDELFEKYQTGIPQFTNDIMSFGSRWQTVKNMTWDWWKEENSSVVFIGGKIEEHLFSEETLTKDLDEIMQTFREDVQANQSKLLSEIRASISTSSVPEIALPDYKEFLEQVSESLKRSHSKEAELTVQYSIVALIVSEAGTMAGQQLVGQLLVKIGTTAAATGAVTGTTMLGTSGAGAGAGAFGGPVGAAIGLGVGVVVGAVLDYFMTKSFKAKLTIQMTDYLQNLKNGLVNGDDKSPGLADDLSTVCESLIEGYRSNLFDSVVSSGGSR